MNLTEPILLFFVMCAIMAVASVLFKGKWGMIAPVMFVTSLVIMLVAGQGFQLRVATEGPFAYIDTVMWVMTGAGLVFALYRNGTFEFLFNKIIAAKRGNFVQMLLLVLFIGLPGMITGSALACVATTGLMAGKYLLDKGVEKAKVVELVAVGSLLGMMMPPLSITGMGIYISRSGIYPAAWEGLFLPMLIVTVPALIVYSIMAGKRILAGVEADANADKSGSAICLVPLLVVFVLVLGYNFLYSVLPYYGGYPIIYLIGFVLALFCKNKSFNALTAYVDGITSVAIELALIMGYASLVETITFAGVSGTIQAQLLLSGINNNMTTLVLVAITLAGGFFLGSPFAYALAGLFTTLITNYNSFYPASGFEMPVLGYSIAVSLTLLMCLRGGIVSHVCDKLETGEVKAGGVVKNALIPVIVMLLVAVVYIMASSQTIALMI